MVSEVTVQCRCCNASAPISEIDDWQSVVVRGEPVPISKDTYVQWTEFICPECQDSVWNGVMRLWERKK